MSSAQLQRSVKYGAIGLALLAALDTGRGRPSRVRWSNNGPVTTSRCARGSFTRRSRVRSVRALADDDEARLADILAGRRAGRAHPSGRSVRRGGSSAQRHQADAADLLLREGRARSEAESFSSIVNDGRRVLVGAFPDRGAGQRRLPRRAARSQLRRCAIRQAQTIPDGHAGRRGDHRRGYRRAFWLCRSCADGWRRCGGGGDVRAGRPPRRRGATGRRHRSDPEVC